MAVADAGTEALIAEWRSRLAARPAISSADVDELEAHLREQMDALGHAGLSDEEALLIAARRMGRLDDVSREFAREHSERLWKQLLAERRDARSPSGLWLALALAVGAAIAVKLPTLLGVGATGDAEVFDSPAPGGGFYLRNGALLVLPFLATLFLVRRRCSLAMIVAVAAPFAAAAILMNTLPFRQGGATETLAGIHVAVVLWLVVGIAYASGDWRSARARMDFVRFSGEWFVYLVLLALGGGVLAGATIGVFGAIGLDASRFVGEWLVPCGAAGAVIVAAWLVEAKQSVIENIAPVLTLVFTPLFTALLLALIVAGILQGNLVETQRDLLIIFDVVLLIVVGLVLYGMSARDPLRRPGWFDRLQLVMLTSAVVVDALVLAAMIGRIGAFGASANKVASLGLNVILLVNLIGAAWLQTRFLLDRTAFGRLEWWQTSYLPVYLVWAAAVVVVFPALFGFV